MLPSRSSSLAASRLGGPVEGSAGLSATSRRSSASEMPCLRAGLGRSAGKGLLCGDTCRSRTGASSSVSFCASSGSSASTSGISSAAGDAEGDFSADNGASGLGSCAPVSRLVPPSACRCRIRTIVLSLGSVVRSSRKRITSTARSCV